MTVKPINLDTTGKRIKYLRKQLFSKKNPKRKLSQEEFSEILDCNKGTVVDWEADNVQPDTDNLIKLADFFGVSVDYLLCRIDEKNHDLNFICEYTGLSESSIVFLQHTAKDGGKLFVQTILDNLLSYEDILPEIGFALAKASACARIAAQTKENRDATDIYPFLADSCAKTGKETPLPEGSIPLPASDTSRFYMEKASRLFWDFIEYNTKQG